MPKYNIYIICRTEDDFLERSKELGKYKAKICHIQWVPAEYLKLTQCNKKLLNYTGKYENLISCGRYDPT